MPEIIHLHDLSHSALDPYVRLTEAQLRSRQNPEKGVLIAESLRVIEHALDAGCQPLSMLMEEKHITGQAADIIARCGNIPVFTGSSALLESLTGYQLHRGILCAMRRPDAVNPETILQNARRVAVIEGVVDPTNVGAIIRSAAALNMDAILLDPTCCDPLHRRAVRVSMGTVFQIPWARIGERPATMAGEGIALLRKYGFKTAAMALNENAVSIDDPALAAEQKLAVVLGTEGNGLPAETIQACDYCVMIPMSHGVDSLNVAAASAVAFWQLGKR
ncbi:MAG: RNA methyltransferase [Clostridia bacterium]|nr:RNA methyltransferase [Clostridia bacterium]